MYRYDSYLQSIIIYNITELNNGDIGSDGLTTEAFITKMTRLQKRWGYVIQYAVDVNTSRTPAEGTHIPNWPNGLIIIII